MVFNTANTTGLSVTYDSSNQKVVVAYCDRGNSDYGTALVGGMELALVFLVLLLYLNLLLLIIRQQHLTLLTVK